MLSRLSRLIVVPGTVQIEVTNRCNLSCTMCPRSYFGLEYKDMGLFTFKHILEKIKPPMEIILTGWGEPLIHPYIFEIIDLCKKKGLTTRMTTNGVLLLQETAKRLVKSGIDSIAISVDSFRELPDDDPRHKYPFIENNIKNLIRAKGVSKKPQVILQPTLHKGKEDDILELIKKGKILGVDRINIVRLDRRFNKGLDVFTAREEQEILRKVITLSNKLKIKVDMLPFTAFLGLKKLFYFLLSRLLYRNKMPCLRLYNYFYITHTGKVTPCCGLPTCIVGDILTTSLEGIQHGHPLKEFKKRQNIVCKGCEVLSFTR